MMKDAQAHADEDKKRREEIEARNKADQAVYGAERFIKDTGDKLPAADRQAIETAAESLKKALEAGDAAAINRGMEELTQAQHKAAASLYQQASSAGQGAASGGGASPGSGQGGGREGASGGSGAKGDVIDAEVVDEGKQ